MLAMKSLRLRLGELLAAEAAYLAPAADNNEVALIKENFSLGETLVIADLTLADFDGSAPLLAELGEQQCGIDPITGDQVVTIKEPAGGWRFETTALEGLPQTIFGYALTTKDGVALLAVALLPVAITLTEVGQEINLDKVVFRIVPEPMF